MPAVQATTSSQQTRRLAIQFTTDALMRAGFLVEPAPRGFLADLLIRQPRRSRLVRVLSAAGPHRRGGVGNLGLHWLLNETAADLIALVDLSRSQGWLFTLDDFGTQAKLTMKGSYHLDWIVARPGPNRSQVPDEAAFETRRFEFALHHL
jgi:hypothetical protein